MKVYKSAGNYIVTLDLLDDTQHNMNRSDLSNLNHAKFRCDRALVLKIKNKDTKRTKTSIKSDFDPKLKYYTNKIVEADHYDPNEKTVCSNGIHFYLTKKTAYFHDKKVNNGKYKMWYDNGQLNESCTLVNNKIEGKYKKWNIYGQLIEYSTHVNNTLEGKYKLWHTNGQLKEHSTYVNSKYEGTYKEWYTNGTLRKQYTYLDGQKQGTFSEWTSNGKRVGSGTIRN